MHPLLLCLSLAAVAADPGKYRGDHPVAPSDDSTVVAEAEEFRPQGEGWKARPWGENYYCATFANAFLSRKAFLGAPEQCDGAKATIEVEVPAAGKYLALVRYEACYRFETQFTLVVEQAGKQKLSRVYGARDNLKIWAFGQKLKKEVAWSWGAGENLVWEGHDALVDLDKGRARLTLVADRQKGHAARRNVDLVMLTSALQEVKDRIDKEQYLPLDGMLTQAGDVHFKVHNDRAAPPLTVTVGNGTEHSPYWVHVRRWKPKTINAKPGESTDWVEVGSLLDTLSDGQWAITARSGDAKDARVRYTLEVGVRGADGKIETVRQFRDLAGPITLAYDADTRYTRRIRPSDEVLFDLVEELRKQPVRGKAPERTLIYGIAFDPRPGDRRYTEAVDEFIRLSGATALNRTDEKGIDTGKLVRGYIDVRGQTPEQLEKTCERLKKEGKANHIAVVSLGDEIGLGGPKADDHAGFQAWLKTQKLKPGDLDPSATAWEQIKYSPGKETATAKPGLYYHSNLYRFHVGGRQLKALTDVLRKHLPNAGVGANFSPHHKHMYLGDTHHWISLFRQDGMTMPWGEDYIWQVPVGTQQMNFLMLDMFRCGVKGKPGAKIHYYVMPHTPGNTTGAWRRQFYGDLGHGAKVLNLFEYRPVQAAYTENHCSDPAMFREVRKSLHELAAFEDVIQDGEVRPGLAGLWFSDAADVWDDYENPMGAGKRSLYIAVRHQQLPLDCVLDGDDLKGYRVLYLTDAHVSRAGSKAIADWVRAGGRLVATAGAGMFDEYNQPNTTLRELLGVADPKVERDQQETIVREKEHLPWAKPIDTITIKTSGEPARVEVYGALTRFKAGKDAVVIGTFKDGSPAVVMNKAGEGKTLYCGCLPGLSYFKPAMPLRPVDRGATEDTLGHLIPTEFDPASAGLVKMMAVDVTRPVLCSEPLVENTVVQSKQGAVITLVNWTPKPVKGLTVRLNIDLPAREYSLASGNKVTMTREGSATVFTLDLDAADALILRP